MPSRILATIALSFFTLTAQAQSFRGLPSLPSSGGRGGMFHGSVGAGFTDFKTLSPEENFTTDRGVFFTSQLERSFEFFHLYLTLGLSYMDAAGMANYDYTNLSSTNVYSITDLDYRARMYEVSLGVKLKLIDDYWFRPYVEIGGIGSYNEVTYGAKVNELSATGDDYKKKDIVMGSGYYGEAGIEIEFAESFGIRLAARQSVMQTKNLETLADRPLRLINETYYLAMMFGL